MQKSDYERLTPHFAGALLGTFCGDALGMPVEGKTADQIRTEHGRIADLLEARLGRGTYTDDTEMMIGVAESLLRRRGFDGQDMARALADHFDEARGYGLGAQKAIGLIRKGTPWDEVGPLVFAEGSFGNGGAMRVAPVALLYADDPDRLTIVAADTARITHSNELGIEGATLQAHAVAMALRLAGKSLSPTGFLRALEDHIGVYGGRPYRSKLSLASRLLARGASAEDVVAELGNGVTAVDSVPTAIYAFAANLFSFEDAVCWAVNLGGDTDTIGAMTGAIAGAFHGVGAIPRRWTDGLENGERGRDYVADLADRLARYACGLPEGAPVPA